jgi:hypothetical protein
MDGGSPLSRAGPSSHWERAAFVAQCIARATGEWENELEIVELARNQVRRESNGALWSNMQRAALARALARGDERVVLSLLSDIVRSLPTDARLVTIALSALLERGRNVEAASVAEHYTTDGSRVFETRETLVLVARASSTRSHA